MHLGISLKASAYTYKGKTEPRSCLDLKASLGVDTDGAFVCCVTSPAAISHSLSRLILHAWAQRERRFVISSLKLEVSLCNALHTLPRGCHFALTMRRDVGGYESRHHRGKKSDMKVKCWRKVSGTITVV